MKVGKELKVLEVKVIKPKMLGSSEMIVEAIISEMPKSNKEIVQAVAEKLGYSATDYVFFHYGAYEIKPNTYRVEWEME